MDLETASRYFPNDIIQGNVEPAIIQTGTPEEVYELSRICIEKGKNHPGGFILSPGCEMPANAPSYKVWMMRKAINDFGWYEYQPPKVKPTAYSYQPKSSIALLMV